MVNMDVIRQRGGSSEALEKLFTEDGKGKSGKHNEKLKPLYNRIRSRIQTGVEYSIRNHKLYYALDLAWNTPLRQVTYTLMSTLVGKKADSGEVKRAINDWGLTHEIVKDTEKGTVDLPVFFNIFIPLVRSYTTIRWAKIMNDRRIYPFLKYDPMAQTTTQRIMSDVITDRVEVVNQQYDFYSVVKQAVFQMLHYGFCIQFPIESWHSEKQLDADGEEVYVREGIRYHMPHPTRVYFDLSHRLATLNTDSGIRYLGYWTIKRWRDIKANDGWWNLDKVSVGSVDWIARYPTFFNTAATACRMNIPTQHSLMMPGLADREKEIGFYSTDLEDSGVMYTEHFEKLNPKKEGLFDYDYEVWMRFCVASDDTIIFAEVLPYTPGVYYGYDSNENQSIDSSLSLEVLPFQDHISNLMTQQILASKQNLANLNLLDQDAFAHMEDKGEGVMSRLKNLGNKWFSSLNIEWFSGRKATMGQSNMSKAVETFRFTPLPTEYLKSSIKDLLDLLERSLVMSAQEVAQAASHEQTAEEVRNIAHSTSTRLMFTSTPVDQAIYAMKNQIYRGLMAYGEEEFYANIRTPVDKEQLEKLGFTVEEPWDDRKRAAVVRARKTALPIYAFASTRGGDFRVNDVSIANAMSQVLGSILGDERIRNAIGDEQSIEFINMINDYMGLPEDFKFRITENPMPPQEQLMQLLQQLQEQVLNQVGESIRPIGEAVKEIGEVAQENSKKIEGQEQLLDKLIHLTELSASQGTPSLPPQL